MPELPINSALIPQKEDVESQIKWFQYLGSGGLSILISVIGLGLASTLFYFLMNNYSEDRNQMREDAKLAREADNQFREQILKATVDHTIATMQQTATQQQTNEILDETKDAMKEVAEKIEEFAVNQKHTGERLDRILEKAWNDSQSKNTPK